MVFRATLAAVSLVGLLCAPALAAGPGDVIVELYAGFPHDADPPGGEAMWSDHMLTIWHAEFDRRAAAEASGEDPWGEGLTFNFLNASQDDDLKDLDLQTIDDTGETGLVRVTLNNGGDAPLVLDYVLVHDGAWKIDEVIRPDSWVLSELIKQTR